MSAEASGVVLVVAMARCVGSRVLDEAGTADTAAVRLRSCLRHSWSTTTAAATVEEEEESVLPRLIQRSSNSNSSSNNDNNNNSSSSNNNSTGVQAWQEVAAGLAATTVAARVVRAVAAMQLTRVQSARVSAGMRVPSTPAGFVARPVSCEALAGSHKARSRALCEWQMWAVTTALEERAASVAAATTSPGSTALVPVVMIVIVVLPKPWPTMTLTMMMMRMRMRMIMTALKRWIATLKRTWPGCRCAKCSGTLLRTSGRSRSPLTARCREGGARTLCQCSTATHLKMTTGHLPQAVATGAVPTWALVLGMQLQQRQQ